MRLYELVRSWRLNGLNLTLEFAAFRSRELGVFLTLFVAKNLINKNNTPPRTNVFSAPLPAFDLYCLFEIEFDF